MLAVHQVRLRGIGAAAGAMMADLWFDLWHGVETALPCEVSEEAVLGPNRVAAVRYQPVDSQLFHALLRALPGGYRDCTFIDYGCGKGKALILAARYAFRSIVGIEFCQRLLRICRSNLSRVAARPEDLSRFRLVHADAAAFCPPPEPAVFFLYNPFDPSVVRAVIGRILDTHVVRGGIDHVVVLANPVALPMFLDAGYRILARRDWRGHAAGLVLCRADSCAAPGL
jgi:SAM-dependent methyltransferase